MEKIEEIVVVGCVSILVLMATYIFSFSMIPSYSNSIIFQWVIFGGLTLRLLCEIRQEIRKYKKEQSHERDCETISWRENTSD